MPMTRAEGYCSAVTALEISPLLGDLLTKLGSPYSSTWMTVSTGSSELKEDTYQFQCQEHCGELVGEGPDAALRPK
jgi:hypothetical protein